MLEEQTSAAAADKATKKDIDNLKSILDRLDEAQNCLDAEKMCDLDVAFHTGIAEASHNSMIIAAMAAVASVWRQETAENFLRSVKQGNKIFERMSRQHRGILESINSRDGQAARERMHEHILDMSVQNL